MRFFKWRKAKEPTPDLDRSLTPDLMETMANLQQEMLEFAARLDEVSKKAEATRRKVYRDGENTPENGHQETDAATILANLKPGAPLPPGFQF